MRQKKSKIKLILSLLACMLLIVGAMAGCGKEESKEEAPVTVRIGSLKGPTTMGLLFLQQEAGERTTGNQYAFQMATGADELLPLMISGKLDIALVPANVAAILYQKTSGGVCAIDVNTLGVLYLVSADDSIASLEDLDGKTIYLTGKGTTPDYVLQYLLDKAGLEGKCNLEYKSEATEVVSALAQKEDGVGFLPQPFVTAACMQNENLKVVFSANELWKNYQGGSSLVTGVTVVTKAFLEEHPAAVIQFLEDHNSSAVAINNDPETGAKYCVEAGIVAKEPIAMKAIPKCNITCLMGYDMRDALEGYLKVLYDYNPETVGGKLPEASFYLGAEE